MVLEIEQITDRHSMFEGGAQRRLRWAPDFKSWRGMPLCFYMSEEGQEGRNAYVEKRLDFSLSSAALMQD